jgi:cell division transport system permease protein
MRLVGATNAFIRTPFFIEGMLQGLIGALVALGVLAACFYLFIQWLAQSSVLPFHRTGLFFLPLHYTLFIIGGGMLTGLLGSLFSLGRYLRM